MAEDRPGEVKNIVLLSDGTGNAASKVWRSNVWRMFQALDHRAHRADRGDPRAALGRAVHVRQRRGGRDPRAGGVLLHQQAKVTVTKMGLR